jgi:hypothetical protein
LVRIVITQFWVIPQNSFSFKIKKIKKRLATWRKQAGEYNYNFGGNSRPNCSLLYPNIEKQCKFKVKLNVYWMYLHKN